MEDAKALDTAVQFLKTGRTGALNERELALWCDRAIGATTRVSIKKGLAQARQFSRRSASFGSEMQLASWRALARLTHMSGSYADALKAYQKARVLARHDPLVRSRIDRALIDVYMYLGDFDRSRRAALRSITTFRKLSAESDLAQSQVNYGNLLHRQDRHREAEHLYHLSSQYFEKTPNHAATARCYYNRANTLVQLFDLDTAEKVYQSALELWEKEGYLVDACDVRYGQAWLKMLRGELHSALLGLTNCELQYREAGNPKGEALCSLDRAEAYLNLAMYSEAMEAARQSERLFGNLKLRYESSKAALFRAQAAFAVKNMPESRAALRRALTGFLQDSNAGFLGAVYLLAAELDGPSTKKGKANLLTARRWFSKSQLPYWKALGDLKQLHWSTQVSATLLRDLRQNQAVRFVPQLYSFWQTSLGDRAFDSGRLAEAEACWSRAADRLDSVRAQLPPVELRTTFARRETAPHTRLVNRYLKSDPMLAACWSERFRTVGLWAPLRELSHSGRRQVEESLSALAQQISFVVRQSSDTRVRGESLSGAASRQIGRLQQQARESLARIENTSSTGADNSIEQISALFATTSSQFPIVQYHIDDADIVAIVHEDGKARSIRFEQGVSRLSANMERWRFLLEGELYRQQIDPASSLHAESQLWKDLGDWLWAPLEVSSEHQKVLVLPDGELANVPWSALQNGGGLLGEHLNFLVSPSLRHFHGANRVAVSDQSGTIFCGPAADLQFVQEEVTSLREQAKSSFTIVDPCRRADWPSHGTSGLWHFIGHAELRADNPFYSFLMLEDGPLFAADFRLKQCEVGLVTLAACRCAEQVALPGEEPTGIVRSLLEMGARTVVAARWPVSDRSTALWMSTFYHRYFSGASASDSAAQASQLVREHNPSATHWSAFAVYGADSTWRSA
ncbi:MAG: CHAT domain-containing protein [bacterium]|nr:CHAT domain-containing protein [bacterium]